MPIMRRTSQINQMSRPQGFTLVEILTVLMIAGFVAMLAADRAVTEAQGRVLEASARSAGTVSAAARRFRLDTGMWPSTTSQLVPGYLHPDQVSTPDGATFQFTTVAGGNLQISYNAGSTRLARQLAGQLPNGSHTGATVRFLSSVPGQEPSLTALYPRDGSRPLTGTMDAADHSIVNVDRISANELRADGEVVASLLRSNVNGAQFVDPNGLSRMRDIDMNDLSADQITARTLAASQGISSGGNIVASGDLRGDTVWGRRFVDTDNTSRVVDPSGTSSMETVLLNGSIRSPIYRISGTQTEGGSCAFVGSIANNAARELMQCRGGSWVKVGGSLPGGRVRSRGAHNSSFSSTNNTNAPIFVAVSGGSGTTASCNGSARNRFDLRADVDGSFVTRSRTENPDWSKVGHISFFVPAGSSYRIESRPFDCFYGRFQVSEFLFE